MVFIVFFLFCTIFGYDRSEESVWVVLATSRRLDTFSCEQTALKMCFSFDTWNCEKQTQVEKRNYLKVHIFLFPNLFLFFR